MSDPKPPRRFPEASRGDRVLSPKIQSAGIRAIHDYTRITRLARAVSSEIGDTTPPHGVPVVELSEEDSMVIAVSKIASTKPGRASTESDD